jgi:hypothetical protein
MYYARDLFIKCNFNSRDDIKCVNSFIKYYSHIVQNHMSTNITRSSKTHSFIICGLAYGLKHVSIHSLTLTSKTSFFYLQDF